MSDRETWERFAAAALSGMHARAGVAAVRPKDAMEYARLMADDMLAATKQRWPEAAADRVPAKVPSEDTLRRLDAMRRDEGETVTVVEFDGAPDTTPRGEDVRSDDGGGVEQLPTIRHTSIEGPLCSKLLARELIAAARREAAEAKRECERLRMTDAEREAIDRAIKDFQQAAEFNEQRFWPVRAKRARMLAETLRGLRDRHARETVAG